MNFNKTVTLFALLIAILCSPLLTYADTYSEKHTEVEKLFKSNEEKTTKDAIWTANNIFKVGVINDGSNRNGYAQYVCSVLDDYGFKGKGIWVQVIDIVKLTSNGKWVKLGESRCK
ncbi:MAG TPA: hypothetical protein VIQ81_00295 [Gammaproteobacteria bacterium]